MRSVDALAPTARVSNVPVAASAVLLAAIPALVAVARGRGDTSVGVTILVMVAAVSVSFAVDDSAANVLSSTPFGASRRRALRLLVLAFVVTALTGATMALVGAGPGLPDDLSALVAPATAAACVAIFVALVAFQREDRGSGATGVVVGLLTVAVTTGLAMRWPRIFPAVSDGPVHDRWWAIAAVGAVGMWRTGRDPAGR